MSAITEFSINQDRAFFDIVNPQYISWEFYTAYLGSWKRTNKETGKVLYEPYLTYSSQQEAEAKTPDYIAVEFEKREPPFGAIGDIVDCRTYRRFIPELNRRERAVEAFLRLTDYNMSLVAHLQAKAELVVEAELMFDALFNLKALPSNRSRWVGGTESVKKSPASIFNCSFCAINRLDAFTDIFNLLCLGVGAGFRVFKRDIKQLPKIVNKGLKIEFEEYKPVPKDQRQENTDVSYAGNSQGAINVDVGDSREGWSTAIKTLLIALTLSETVDNAAHTIIYNFDSVRPFGERILGFGGKASGYQALQGILQEIHKIITECPDDYLRSIDCMDICCATARGVIAGSSRRSALITLFDEDDDLCRNAKTDWQLLEATGKTYRSQSNNTCCVGSIHYEAFIELLATDPTEEQVLDFLERVKPPKSFFDNAFKVMRALGEPAIDHFLLMVYKRYLAARKHRPNEDFRLYVDVCTNPCHEVNGTVGIDGYSGGFCNLCTNDLVKCVKAAYQAGLGETAKFTHYYFNYVECEQLVRLMVRTGIRQTEVNVPMKGWNETQRKERLLGVDAVNGFQDAIALLGWEFDDENSSDLRKKIRQWANDEADKYSAKLGIERPLLVTCVKPNGNTGAVLGVSSGIHWGWDSYYMRRVTCNAQDSLSKTLLDQGFTAYPANNDHQLGTKLQKMFFKCLDPELQMNVLMWLKKELPIWKILINTTGEFIVNKVGLLKIPFVAQKLEEYGLSLIDQVKYQFPTQVLLDYFITLPKETQLDILNSCNSIVFEFPIKTTANKSCNEITAIDQLRNQFLFSTEYTDHLPSVTITVKSHEWEDVVNWVFAHWNEGFITASFFSFFEESYPLLANQSISEEEYGKALLDLIENARGVKRLDTPQGTRYAFMLDEDLLNKYESGANFKEEEDLKVDNCTTGCPIK